MIIIWGGNPARRLSRHAVHPRCERQGARLVVIGPLFDATAAKADQWVPIRPATDAALAMAMINVILQEGLYDKSYIINHTVGPFLVRNDSKLFLREGGKHAVWDEQAKESRSVKRFSIRRFGGRFNAEGSLCKTAFELLAERTASYTPEKAEEITGVPAETTRNLAREYAGANRQPSECTTGWRGPS